MSETKLDSVIVQGRKLAWREAGSGPAVVMLHGIGSNSAAWAEQLSSLAHSHRMIALDAPGYGGSDGLSTEAPWARDYGAALELLLNELGVTRAHLVGISLGALIAAAFAARCPSAVASLVLSNVAVGHAARSPSERKKLLEARISDIETLGAAGLADKRSPRLMGPDASEAARTKVRNLMAQLRPDGYAQAARMLSQEDIFEHLRGWKGPTLVVASTEDAVTPLESVRPVAEACPGARFEEIAGVGHQPQIEAPQRFNAVVEAFLQSVQELAA